MRRSPVFVIVSFISLALPLAPAHAHGLLVHYQVQADQVEVRATFDDGTAAALAKVTVRDSNEQVIAKGQTDAAGMWTFARPGPGAYRVTVNAGGGHVEDAAFQIGDPQYPQEHPPPAGWNREPDTAGSLALKIAMGLSVIGLLALALLVAARRRPARL